MKTLLSIFLLSFGTLSVCYAQNMEMNTPKFQNCESIIHKFYPKVKNIKTKKADKIASISCVSEHTLSNHSDIKKYFHKISDKNNYYYIYNPKVKGLVLQKGKNIKKNSKNHKSGFSFLNKKLHSVLTTSSTVYVMKLKTNSGKIFRDYLITNAKDHFAYDNSFAAVIFFKAKKTSTEVKK
jgi:hypothetical protein